jgi:hypothetical protein
MFFGTSGQTVVIRVGEVRAAALAIGPLGVFEPKGGQARKEYVQLAADALPDEAVLALTSEALALTALLPANPGWQGQIPVRTQILEPAGTA